MFERFGKIAVFFAFLAAAVGIVQGVFKKYYAYLESAPDDYDDGDELVDGDEVVYEVPNPLAQEDEEESL